MPGSIFLVHDDGKLVEMKETPYDSEALLQGLLADYSNLLAGDQIDPDHPRRWLLVTREMRVSGDEGTDRGYLDHLFLDQDAVPTLVEVKSSEVRNIARCLRLGSGTNS
jgi:hypothetical protein